MESGPMLKKHHYIQFSLLLFLVIFARFFFVLDRYPLVNAIDEPALNQPAISYHDGHSLLWAPAPNAPYENELWFYHGPFYPRFQTFTFRILGISEFSSRLPQYLASSLAILALSLVLICSGLPKTGVLLPIAWLGDRSSIEVLLARPEGIALLALAGAFVVLIRRQCLSQWLMVFLAGFCTALAAGFHPRACVFVIGAFVFLAADLGLSAFRRLIPLFVLGVAIPVSFMLWCAVPVSRAVPDIQAAMAQLAWHAHLSNAENFGHLRKGFTDFRWSCPWVWAAALATVAVTCAAFARRKPLHRVVLAASCFACCGLIMFLTSITMHPPYLVFLTVWPVIAVMAQIESGSSQRRLFRVIAAVLLVAWLPSMGWNMMRTREAYKFYSALSTAHLADELAATIPPEAPLMVSGDLYIAARSPTRKPFIVRQASPPSEWPCDAWLALTTSAVVPWNVSQLPGRVVHVSNENLFPGFPYSPKLTILTPCQGFY